MTTEMRSRQRRIGGGRAAKGSEGPEAKLHSCLAEAALRWVYLSFPPLPFNSLFLGISKSLSDNHFASFIFLGDRCGRNLLCNVMNLHP